MHVDGAQCRSMVHNTYLYRWSDAEHRFHKPRHTCNSCLCGSVVVRYMFVQKKYWRVARQIRVVVGCTMDEMTDSYLCMSVKGATSTCQFTSCTPRVTFAPHESVHTPPVTILRLLHPTTPSSHARMDKRTLPYYLSCFAIDYYYIIYILSYLYIHFIFLSPY